MVTAIRRGVMRRPAGRAPRATEQRREMIQQKLGVVCKCRVRKDESKMVSSLASPSSFRLCHKRVRQRETDRQRKTERIQTEIYMQIDLRNDRTEIPIWNTHRYIENVDINM